MVIAVGVGTQWSWVGLVLVWSGLDQDQMGLWFLGWFWSKWDWVLGWSWRSGIGSWVGLEEVGLGLGWVLACLCHKPTSSHNLEIISSAKLSQIT